MGRVYPIFDRYWAEYGISFKEFHGYGLSTRLVDTRPDYPKPHTHLPDLIPKIFNLYFYILLTLVY
ncbi:hypothetical protein Hanom_Chr16g01430691 [Helianthus anomalus]